MKLNLPAMCAGCAAVIGINLAWPQDHIGFEKPAQVIVQHEFIPAPPAVCPPVHPVTPTPRSHHVRLPH